MAVRYRHVQAKIYRKSKRYPYYRLVFTAEGKRRMRTFTTYAAARAAAKGIVRQIAKGNDAAASLSLKEAHAYKFAVNKLRELAADLNCRKTDMTAPDVVFSLEDAIVEFVEAKRALGGGRLAEAVAGFLSTISKVRRVKVSDAVEEFLREREAKTKPEKEGARPQLSPKMAFQDRSRMRPFIGAFQMDVCDFRSEHFDLFFREHLKGLVAKTRNGYRNTLHFWLKWCVRKGYLPDNHRLHESNGLSPDGKKQELTDTGDIEFYTPKEFLALLTHSQGSVTLQPLIAIGGLAGLRTQELLRLDWSDVWRRPGYIEVSRSKAKTRQRRLIPISAALAVWLKPWRTHSEGSIWPNREVSFHEYFREVAEAAKVTRKDNGLRHSFISYRLAETHDENKVAQEAGTSPAMIHKHYRELVTPEEATEWFNVLPEAAAMNIMPIHEHAKDSRLRQL